MPIEPVQAVERCYPEKTQAVFYNVIDEIIAKSLVGGVVDKCAKTWLCC